MSKFKDYPVLPGYKVDPHKQSQQKFNKSQHFGVRNDVCMLTDVARPNPDGTLVVAEGQVPPGPKNHWLYFDKQVLKFDADCFEKSGKKKSCQLYYFLEDDTIQVVEPKVTNSGCFQGTLIHRHRVPMPTKWEKNRENVAQINSMAAHGSGFYSVASLNVGNTLDIYGRRFVLTGCDRFTRLLLEKLGLSVPQDKPQLRAVKEEDKKEVAPKSTSVPDERRFLKLDGVVLSFKGYWDDREHEGGLLHKVTLLFYLADDTLEVLFEDGGRMVKRQCLPKKEVSVDLGAPDQLPILNVMKGRQFLKDASPADGAYRKIDYVRDHELFIGATVNVYGRPVVLVSCDKFTQKYYNDRYGKEDFTPLPYPRDETRESAKHPPKGHLPPYNGFGSYEDSAANCKSFIMKERQKDLTQFFTKDRQGLESHVLRFAAKLKEGCEVRKFIFSYYLSDDTISIHEVFTPNTGYKGGKFLERGALFKPNQDMLNVDDKPELYRADDFFIGATIVVNKFEFVLHDADDYALTYMETNCREFPLSNSKLILDKMRPHLGTRYKDMVAALMENDDYGHGAVATRHFRDILEALLPEDFLTEHEYVTLLRRYAVPDDQPPNHALRSKVHSLLQRQLFKDIDLLKIELIDRDHRKTGFLDRNNAWAACRSLPVPLPVDLLAKIFDTIKTSSNGDVDYQDLLWYLDCENQPANLEIQNEGAVGFMFARKPRKSKNEVSYKTFLEELRLENQHLKQIS
ncbi:EF-hand domain-containing family member C2-like [Neocloeon triangulifer]|uniref:EF-hand domain-containing family member C2-like n=1 Tax=Neocloeon triangulifer TaxID=2078957 RepID=UPI00286F0494|nr:EF-hand domain-containing family member C2-like [Neocloeon triangulifer]